MDLSRCEQLILLFAGEQDEGAWLSEPCYTVPLAVAIAREVRPATSVRLREVIFGDQFPTDLIDPLALDCIQIGFDRWRVSGGKRGL